MCLFCDIAAHKFDANIVDETERTITFLDIAPANEGHVLIIPKLHVDSILDTTATTGSTRRGRRKFPQRWQPR